MTVSKGWNKINLKKLLNYDINLTKYTILGLSILVYSFYLAYYLTKDLWIEPDLKFIYIWSTKNFPEYGFFLCIVPVLIVLLFTCIGNYAITKDYLKKNYLKSIASITGFIISFLFLLTLIPFSISISLLYLGLATIDIGLMNFRNVLTDSELLPDKKPSTKPRKDSSFVIKIERAHNRCMELQRQSIWMVVTAVFGTLVNSVLIFQSRLYGYFGGDRGWMALVFARYQLVIFGIMFVYYVLGFLIFLTFFCYKKQILLEKML